MGTSRTRSPSSWQAWFRLLPWWWAGGTSQRRLTSLLTASEREQVFTAGPIEPVIRIQDISVRFRVPRERIKTFKEYAIRSLQGKIRHDQFWALKNVNLEVNPREVFGIIGRNGAGKSTLLKV